MILRTGYRYFMNALKRYNKFALLFVVFQLLLAPIAASAALVCEPNLNDQKNKALASAFGCKQQEGITYRFTECVHEILKNVAQTGFDNILSKTGKIVGAVLTLFVAFTGMKMVLGGVRNVKAEGVTTLLKVAFVAAFTLANGVSGGSGLQQSYDLVHGINSGLIDLVGSQVASDPDCAASSTGDAEQKLWKRVDCTILAFIGKVNPGYDTVDIDRNEDGVIQGDNEIAQQVPRIKRGEVDLNCNGTIEANEKNVPIDDFTLFDIGLSQLFTPHGIFLLFLLMAAALMVFAAFARALQVYVISMVAVTFLMLLGPFFIPMFLFMRTRQMFTTWLIMILGYVIQPAMLMAFLVFLLASMNTALHGSPGSPGLKDSLDNMNAAMKTNHCTRKVWGEMQNSMMGNGANVTQKVDAPTLLREVGKEIYAITVPVTDVPYPDLAIFMVHLIACMTLLYVMMALMANVADFVAALTAGAGSNLSRYGGGMQQLIGAAKDGAATVLK